MLIPGCVLHYMFVVPVPVIPVYNNNEDIELGLKLVMELKLSDFIEMHYFKYYFPAAFKPFLPLIVFCKFPEIKRLWDATK